MWQSAEDLQAYIASSECRGGLRNVRVLILDESALHREILAAAIADTGNCRPAVAWDVPSLCARAAEAPPDIVLLSMVNPSALKSLSCVRQTCPRAKVIVLGICEGDEPTVVACAEAGVVGYHLRTESLADLVSLMSRVVDGESGCSPKISTILLKRLSTLAGQRRPPVTDLVLTAREAQILQMLEMGMSNRDIADSLCIALHTVKNHVHSVLGKLGVSTRTEAAAYSYSVDCVGDIGGLDTQPA